jgi:hypothetical protein
MKAKANPTPGSDLPPKLGAPAERALASAGYTQLAQIAAVSEATLKQLHGVGPTALEKLRVAMAAKGLAFAASTGNKPAVLSKHLANLFSDDSDIRYAAYLAVIKATDQPVDWAHEIWDKLLVMLRDANNHKRTIAAQVLCNLAKSDPQKRMLKDFPAILAVTKDERFVTARHTLQNLWKVALGGRKQQVMLLAGLTERYSECASEKNGTLIRFDIIQSLRTLYDAVKDDAVRACAVALIERESDLKYRKKYAAVWRGITSLAHA